MAVLVCGDGIKRVPIDEAQALAVRRPAQVGDMVVSAVHCADLAQIIQI